MSGFKFNFITILAFSLLVIYAYLAAMGFLYQNGNILYAGLFFITILVVVSVCIYLMCRARATRWEKIGIPSQIALGVVIVVTFFLIGQPFSSYITMLGQSQKVSTEIKNVVTTAKDLNIAYNDYAKNRIARYNPREQNNTRKELRINALKQELTPPLLIQKQNARNSWLDEISEMGLSNVQMPNNLKNMATCVNTWMQDYSNLSAVVFSDEEDVQAFDYPKFASAYESLSASMKGYSMWAFLVAILCSVFMLIPYFTTEPDYALREGNEIGARSKFKKKLFHPSDDEDNEQGELDYL